MGLNSFKFSLSTPSETFVHATSKQAITIGRSLKCDFNVPKEDLSREHCLVEIDNNDIFITDLGSKNGISINRARISPNKRYPISRDEEVLLSNKYLFKLNPIGIEIKSKLDLVGHEGHGANPSAAAAAETVTIELEAERKNDSDFFKNRPPTSVPAKYLMKKMREEKKEPLVSPEAIKMLLGFFLISMALIYSLMSE